MNCALAPRFLVFVALLAAATALFGCSKTYIPNTDVEDTSDNRKVILFCEDYRHAVEGNNLGALYKMASPQYQEDGGNTTGVDDYDYTSLKDNLAAYLGKATGIRYEIRYRRVTFTDKKRIHVDYTYAASYRIPGTKGEEWRHTVADNRLELVEEGDSFKIVRGM